MRGADFVAAIEAILNERKIKKGDFYRMSGISRATFSQWRCGIYDPSSEAISKIESVLGVKIGFEIDGQPAVTDELSQEEHLLLEVFRSLKPDQRQFLLKQVQAVSPSSKVPGAPE